jgi:ornithine cyclodeaminase/alanine dehydrogenase-like protein (mu-crystallin family)
LDALLIRPVDIGAAMAATGAQALFQRVIRELKGELKSWHDGDVRLPQRTGFVTDPDIPSVLEWMPYAGMDMDVTLKVVAYNPSNDRRGLPSVVGSIAVYDGPTGHLHTLVDGIALTAIRTGAASAVASSVLAASSSKVLGIVGAGAQAVAQVYALCAVLPIDRVLVYDRAPEAAASLQNRCDLQDMPILQTRLEDVEEGSDIICTATSVEIGQGPVIVGDHLAAHAHINAVGSDLPGKTELPRSVLQRAFVTPDFPAQAHVEGECQQLAIEEVGPPLADLIRYPDRYAHCREDLTVFDSTGMGLQDHVVARVIREIVTDLNLGVRIPLQHFGADPRDPFDFQSIQPNAS